jgi:hypothetical protein
MKQTRAIEENQPTEDKQKKDPQFRTVLRKYLNDFKTIAMEFGKLKPTHIGIKVDSMPNKTISREVLNEITAAIVECVENHEAKVIAEYGGKKKRRRVTEDGEKRKGGGIVAPVFLSQTFIDFLKEAKLPGLDNKVFEIVFKEGFGIPTFVSSLLGYYALVKELKDIEAPNHPCHADVLMKKHFGEIFKQVYEKEAQKSLERYKVIEKQANEGDEKCKQLIKEWPFDENEYPYKLHRKKNKDGRPVFVQLFHEDNIIQANFSSITGFLTEKINKEAPENKDIITSLPEITQRIHEANSVLKELKDKYKQ